MKGQQQVQRVVRQLQQNAQITIFQLQSFLSDLHSQNQKVQLINKAASSPQLTNFLLKYFIQGTYHIDPRSTKKGKTHPLLKKQSYEDDLDYQKKKQKLPKIQDEASYDSMDIIDWVKDQSSKLLINTQNIKNSIIQSIIFRDEHRLRHKNTQILSQIFLISSFKCLVYHSNGKIQSHNSKINYVTQIFENNPKYPLICKFMEKRKIDQVLDVSQDQQFGRIFSCSKGIGVIKIISQQYYMMVLQMQDFPFNKLKQLKQNNIFLSLIRQINWKLAQINLCPLDNFPSQYIFQYYAKSWLQLLQLTSRLDQQLLLLKVKKIIPIIEFQQNKDYLNLQQIISRNYQQQIDNTELKKQISKYQNLKQKEYQNLRLYKKYLNDQNCCFLDFNYSGRLNFISNNHQKDLIEQIRKLWGHKQIQISDIFFNNKKLHSLIRKGSKGLLQNGKFYQIQQMKVKIYLNNENFIERIHIVIQQQNIHSSQSITQDKNTSTHNLTQVSSKKNVTLKDLQKLSPGIQNQGWISLFLKGNQLKNSTQFPRSKAVRQKRTRSQNNMSYILNSQKNLHSIVNSLTIQQINVDNLDINILQFDQNNLQPFTAKELTEQKNLFTNFVSQLHQNYEIYSNPFHNFRHGVNVMHTSYLISTIPKNKQVFTPFKIFTNVFSALCHDVGHTGFTNAFEIASQSQKAITYNDNSPLENFHASRTFQLLRKPNNNFLCLLKKQEYNQFRKDVISNILYTDIKEHFPLLKKFEDRKAKDNLLTPDDATILSGIIIHCSDFGGSVKQFQISRDWSERVNKQFTNQYYQQGKLGLPQTPFMKDLTKIEVLAKNQLGFLKVIVHPLYKALNQFYVDDYRVKKLHSNLNQNIKIWENKLQSINTKTVIPIQKQSNYNKQ